MSDVPASYAPKTKIVFGFKGDLAIGVLFITSCVMIYVCFGDMRYYVENALFETCQNTALFLGALFFAIAAHRATDIVSRHFWAALSLFVLCILFREIEVRGTVLEPYLGALFEGRWDYVALGLLWCALLFVSWRHMRQSFQALWQWLFSLSGAVFLVGCFFYIFGDIAEKHLLTNDGAVSEMIEESFEQLGTLFIFFSSYAALRRQL